jgi:hypothetical protein
MTNAEQQKLTLRAGIYLTVAEHCNYTSFATLVIGVPLTLAAFAGMSIWPGAIFWTVSWCGSALSDYYLAAAKELRRRVNDSRTD